MIQSFLYGLCLDYFEERMSFSGEQFILVRDVVRELTDHVFDFDRVTREGRDRFSLYVRTEGNEDNPLPIQKCSQGTSSVIAMFGLIYDYLKSLEPSGVSEIRKRRGIVIIDEVDAHLHPVWQQKILTLLRDRFPRVQFIVTAHNPIVIAGCLEDEVSVLRRTSAEGFSLVQFPNDFIGWAPEDIYRKVFDIEGPDIIFTRLDALRPFKGQLRKEADDLASKSNRSSDEERSLQKLEEQLLYIDKIEDARAKRLTQDDLERENEVLRIRYKVRVQLRRRESLTNSVMLGNRKNDASPDDNSNAGCYRGGRNYRGFRITASPPTLTQTLRDSTMNTSTMNDDTLNILLTLYCNYSKREIEETDGKRVLDGFGVQNRHQLTQIPGYNDVYRFVSECASIVETLSRYPEPGEQLRASLRTLRGMVDNGTARRDPMRFKTVKNLVEGRLGKGWPAPEQDLYDKKKEILEWRTFSSLILIAMPQ